jgi:hypothetical protein
LKEDDHGCQGRSKGAEELEVVVVVEEEEEVEVEVEVEGNL